MMRFKIINNHKKSMIEKKLTYVSLFSSAWVWCYGFKLEWFDCIATNELLEKRMEVQRANKKCSNQNWYIVWDITEKKVIDSLYEQVKWKHINVIIATPPCQGISIANHKKNNETPRNSLIIESINFVKNILPDFFIFENVRWFLWTKCQDTDWKIKIIWDVIDEKLLWYYNIERKIVNFKEYWVPSSRTRTLIIWSKKELRHISPLLLYPDKKAEIKLIDSIWKLKALKNMWEIDDNDVRHNFRIYNEKMLKRVSNTPAWSSAFDNKNPLHRPHQIIDWKLVSNQNKNGDKYTRCMRDSVWPCIHTRNDILASQNTIHPVDNRVFSVRELMILMSIPQSFKWVHGEENLNTATLLEKKEFIKKNDIMVRQSIWEAVPTLVFQSIANKIKLFLEKNKILEDKKLTINLINKFDKLNITGKESFINATNSFELASLILEYSNSKRWEHAAYYTSMGIGSCLLNQLPELSKNEIRILEPSVWLWNFLPLIINKYSASTKNIIIDVIDINIESLNSLRKLVDIYFNLPKNVTINYIHSDYLDYSPKQRYDVIIWNPPYGKWLKVYDSSIKTNNLFAQFMSKAINEWDYVSFIIPKAFLSAPEYNIIRKKIEKDNILWIADFWEKGFPWVKIETIGLTIDTSPVRKDNTIKLVSYIMNEYKIEKQNYICDNNFPYRLIYRDIFFDKQANKLRLWMFISKRSRSLTKSKCALKGKIKVISSRNIDRDGNLQNMEDVGYVDYMPKEYEYLIDKWGLFVNGRTSLLVFPNLTYKPRIWVIKNTNIIPDWSLAILSTNEELDHKKIEYISSEEYEKFYRIARNHGTRSLNIDSNSIYFIWIPK